MPFADQRLAPGDAQLLHAKADEGTAEPVKFFKAEEVGLGQEGHVFRHAVGAAEIAAVGDRDAQIADRAGEGIDELLHPGKVGLRGWAHKAESGDCEGRRAGVGFAA
jgi:hypothetical protein